MADHASTLSQWQQQASQLTICGLAFINGEYTPALGGETFPCHSPIDGQCLTVVASCQSADADVAVVHARAAFDRGIWSQASPSTRKQVLHRFADLMAEHADELALLETLDMGKPIANSLGDDIPGSINCIRWYAEAIDKIYDEVSPSQDHQLGLITREPVGVVAAIVPWNFPLNMACWKLGPALAAGNSVILKPSEKSPLTAIRIAALAQQAGLPNGVLQVLPGYGHTIGKALAEHKDVDTVVFTGSTKVAKQLLISAGHSNMKRVWLEAGGKSPNIVFADAQDLDHVAEMAAMAIFFNQGEVCTAGSRLLVQESIYQDFVARLQSHVCQWQPSHPLDPNTKAGAIVDKVQFDNILHYIDLGQNEGAQLLCGGHRCHTDTGGFYIEPTIFIDADNTMRIAQEEIFGPVLTVIPFATEDDAIRIANDTEYGLAAALWTADLNRAHRCANKLRAGSVWINTYHGGDMTAPFGGFKQSGNGRDKSLHAFDKYTELKATWIALA